METEYTYTATDADDDTVTLPFDITVEADATPAFADGETIADQNYIMGTAIPATTLPAVETDGNGATTYTLTPALPVGLTFDAASRELSGTPTTAAVVTGYTYTATDADDDTVTLTFDITVVADTAPSFGTETVGDQTFTVGETVALTLPAATGGNGAITYAFTDRNAGGAVTLPDGLTYNADATPPTITGMPTTATTTPVGVSYVASDSDLNTAAGDQAAVSFDISVIAATFAVDAGADQTVAPGGTVTLTATVTGANTPDSGLTFAWSVPGENQQALSRCCDQRCWPAYPGNQRRQRRDPDLHRDRRKPAG